MRGEDASPGGGDVNEHGETPEQRARRERNERVEQLGEQTGPDDDLFPAVEDTDENDDGDVNEDDLPPVRPFVGVADTTPESRKTVTRIEIPVRTIVTVAVSLLLIWVLTEVWGILVQFLISFLVATALLPLVQRLRKRGMSKGSASLLVFAGLIALIVGFFWLVLPPLITQTQNLIDHAPEYLRRFEVYINRYPSLADLYDRLNVDQIAGDSTGNGADVPVDQAIQISVDVISRLTTTFFVLVMTFYLLVEGGSAWRFVSRYFSPRLRYRLLRTYPEITHVVSGYVVGQAITSAAFSIFAFVLLRALDVPQALFLAVLAAALDAVPIIGAPAATVPAVILALSVSWETAVIVFVAYVIYQQIENYILVPRIYGRTMQVSSLSILVGVLIGGALLGIVGILLALPLTAAIPVLERVWNEPLPDDIVEAEAQEAEAKEEEKNQEERPTRRRYVRPRGGQSPAR